MNEIVVAVAGTIVAAFIVGVFAYIAKQIGSNAKEIQEIKVFNATVKTEIRTLKDKISSVSTTMIKTDKVD